MENLKNIMWDIKGMKPQNQTGARSGKVHVNDL